jgi:hypothetical protein
MKPTSKSTALLEALASIPSVGRNRGCSVGRLLADLNKTDPDAVDIIRGWMEQPTSELGHIRLGAALAAAGLKHPSTGRPLSRQVIGGHRNDDCGCKAAGLS